MLVAAGVGWLPGVAATGCEARDIPPRASTEDEGVVGPTVVVGGVDCLGVPIK